MNGGIKMNEKTETITEPCFRVNMKQLANGEYRADMTCRADSIEDLKKKFEEMKVYVLEELKKLNSS